jgi:glutamate/tyrosine decarboxylase-like PLP-dependent enzyme
MQPSVWNRLAEEIGRLESAVRELPVLPDLSAAELRAELTARYRFDAPRPLAAVTEDVIRLLRRGIVHVTHPRYFGLFNPSVLEGAIVGDVLAAAFNPQLAAWSHAPAAIEIERHTLRCFSAVLGLDPDATTATFTAGGAEANLQAVLAAIAHRFPETGAAGLMGLERRPAIYVTGESHHSFVKIARMTGLGTASLRQIPTTPGNVLDVAALERRIERDRREERIEPLVIVGTAGTTSAGLVDPLAEIAAVAARAGAWFHVDAAWGGAAALSPKLWGVLDGIQRADSITWDAHKWLSVPMGAGMFFCRHPQAVARAFAASTSYMPPPAGSDTVDPYVTTAQWTRRAIGLKVFMVLAQLGLDGYRALIERQAEMGDLLREKLRQAGWTAVGDTPLPVVCFTHPDLEGEKVTTAEILQEVYRRRNVWISDVELRGRRVLRACITSFRTDPSDVSCLIDELEHARHAAREAGTTATTGAS